MKIGLFGGAFNPIHNGHINLAKCYKQQLKLDKIIFIPTAIPPHKTAENLVSKDHRMNMLHLAVDDIDGFEISDVEFNRQGKSYSYDTILEIKKLYPSAELYLIVGADQFFSFTTWYKYKEILDMVVLCTAARQSKVEQEKLQNYKQLLPQMESANCIVSNFDVVVVSSSDIRDKICNAQDISNLVPKNVCSYIKENKLYAKC